MKHLFWLVAVLIAIARIAFAQSPGTQSSGVLEWSLWSNIEGAEVDDIKFHPQYAETPTVRQFVSGSASPVNYGENFGQRLRGLVTAPVTGEYIFWIASDDCSELWLGTSASRFNKRPIANVHGWTGVQNWDVYPSQGSIAINLQAGQKYWIEAIAKEATEGDHVEIAWQYPGQPRQLIPAQYLSAPPVDAEDMNDDNLPDVWADQFGVHGEYTDSDNDGVRNIDEYRLNLGPSDTDSDDNGVPDGEQTGLDGTYLASLEGVMEWSVWKNIPGVQVKDLTVNPAFSGAPTIRRFVSGSATPVDHGDNFGQRLRGLVTASVTGDYTFWIASDDSSELWLGINSSRFSKRRIANLSGWTGVMNWDAYPSQRSFTVTLNEGQSYWIEAIAKEGSGGDHVEIAWQYPGQTRQPIPAQHVSAAIRDPQDLNDDNLPDQWASQFGVNGEYVDADGDGLSNFEEFRIGFDPSKKDSDDNGIDDDEQVSVGGTYLTTLEGTLEWSAWLGLPGVDIRDLTGSASFAGAPTVRRYVSEASSPSDYANDFGQRLRGTVTVPVTGEYTFWIASDDASELWLGTSGSRFSKRVIAGLRGWTSVQNWDAYPSQKSRTVTLQAGQKYWIEALAKDGGGMDHVAIAWAYPGQARQMIPAQFLAAPVADPEDLNDDNLPDPWALQYRVNGEYGDDDDDGVVNYQEYLLGTLPTEGDSDGNGVLDGQQLSFLGEYLATLEGTLEWSAWLELPGVDVRDLTGSTSFAGAPSVRRYVSEASSPVNYADNFGQRLRGTVTAPETGEYTFWIASDDASELWLGTSASRFSKRVIAGLRGSTSVQNWDVYPTQKSRTVTLQAGQKYWIEALAKDGGGMDHVAIAWAYPGQARQVIPGPFLAAPVPDPEDVNDDNLPDAWANQFGVSGEYGDADGDGLNNFDEYRYGTNPTIVGGVVGYLTRDLWTGLPNNRIEDLTQSVRFLGPPDLHELRAGVNYLASNTDDDFGQRLRGTVLAPVSGRYTFWIAGDDNCELWLSSDNRKFRKKRIAFIEGAPSGEMGWVNYGNFNSFASQQSAEIEVLAGQRYYIEILHKEGKGMEHVEVAWQVPALEGEIIPSQYLESFVNEADDFDEDDLSDTWERQYGLDAADNGRANLRQAGYSDYDGDSLTNRAEFLLGLDPTKRDTDGDGLTDALEVKNGANPLVSNDRPFAILNSLSGGEYSDASGIWEVLSDKSVVANDPRGSISYQFSVPYDGVWGFELEVRPVGVTSGVHATMPLDLYIDGFHLGAFEMHSLNGILDRLTGLSQMLQRGDHTFKIVNRNASADRFLQVIRLDVLEPQGADLDEDGIVDWLTQVITSANYVIPPPSESYTSPLCLEGQARFLAGAAVLLGNEQRGVTEQVNGGWFANLPLEEDAPTVIDAQFESEAVTHRSVVNWKALNVVEFQDTTINVRVGDSLRLTAFPVGSEPNESEVTLWILRTELDHNEFAMPANQSKTHPFSEPGVYTIIAQYTDADVLKTATMHVRAVSADFGGRLEAYVNNMREWLLPHIEPDVALQWDNDLIDSEVPSQTGTGRKFQLIPRIIGTHYVMARLGVSGPILARGEVIAFQPYDAGRAADTQIIYVYDDGDKLVRSGIVLDGLPPGGYAEVSIFVAGVTFEDGTTTQRFYASDVDANGVLYINFNYPNGTLTSVCHRIKFYDAEGQVVGTL